MTIIGIDPAITKLGVAVIDDNNDKINMIETKRISFSANKSPQRLKIKKNLYFRFEEYSNEVCKLIDIYKPDFVIIEIPFIRHSTKALINLMKFIGYLIKSITLHIDYLKIKTVDPQEVKGFITGNRQSKKDYVKKAICDLMGINGDGLSFDEADALSIAYTGYLRKILG